MVKIEKGKTIFDSSAQTLVNTINCVGVMGKGLALEFKNRYPEMFKKYKSFCDNGVFKPGVLWIYKADDGKWILNFPTKIDWKNPSKIEYIEEGLKKFVEIWEDKGITSIAFPLLGCKNGALDPDDVIPLMKKYLKQCEGLDVTIYDDRKDEEDEVVVEILTAKKELTEDVTPKEIVVESKPLVDEEPPKPTDDVEEKKPSIEIIEEDENPKEEVKEGIRNITQEKLDNEIISEEQEILKEIVEERKAINNEVDKILNEFVNKENTPEVRRAVTKKLYNVINRRGFPSGSVFQI